MSVLGIPPLPYHASLVGMVDHAMTERVAKIIVAMRGSGVTRARIAVHSDGGYLADGIAIYNLLRGSGVDIHMHCVGNVASAAVYVFLAGRTRSISKHGKLLVHYASAPTPQRTTTRDLTAVAAHTRLDDARAEAVLREHAALTDAHWDQLKVGDLVMGAEEAKACGLVHEISEFNVPPGALFGAI